MKRTQCHLFRQPKFPNNKLRKPYRNSIPIIFPYHQLERTHCSHQYSQLDCVFPRYTGITIAPYTIKIYNEKTGKRIPKHSGHFRTSFRWLVDNFSQPDLFVCLNWYLHYSWCLAKVRFAFLRYFFCIHLQWYIPKFIIENMCDTHGH